MDLKSNRNRRTDQIIADVRAKTTAQETGIHIEFGQMLQDMIGDGLTSATLSLWISSSSARTRTYSVTGLRLLARVSPKINGRSRRCFEWDRKHNQWTCRELPGKAGVTAKTGFTPEEVETDSNAILKGETPSTPLVVNSRAYTSESGFRSAIEVRSMR